MPKCKIKLKGGQDLADGDEFLSTVYSTSCLDAAREGGTTFVNAFPTVWHRSAWVRSYIPRLFVPISISNTIHAF